MEIYQFTWTKDITVNEPVIDLQHQRLLAQVNKLIGATLIKFDNAVLSEAVKFFDEYIKEHFLYEENYMRSMGYPEIENHLAEHKNFIDQYHSFKKDISEDFSHNTLFEMETYIGNWWLQHIGKEDKKYAVFIMNKSMHGR